MAYNNIIPNIPLVGSPRIDTSGIRPDFSVPLYSSSKFNSMGLFDGLFGLLGSGISAASNVAAVNATNRANMAINKMNNQFNHDENTLAYQRQRQLINEQNEYNSYSNQRSLMEQAGYNPNSLVGSTAGTAVSSSSTNTNAAQAASPIAMQAAKLDLANSFAAIQSTLSQAALNDAQARNLDANTNEIAPNAESQRLLNKTLSDLNNRQLDIFDRDIQMADRNIRLFDATFEDQKQQLKILNGLNQEQSDYFKAQSYAIRQRLDIDQKTFDYMLNTMWPAQVDEIVSRTGLNRANATAALMNAWYLQSMKTSQDLENDLKDSIYNGFEFKYPDFQNNKWSEKTGTYAELIANTTVAKAIGEGQYWIQHARHETNGIPYLFSVNRSYSGNGSFLFGLGSGGSSWTTNQLVNPVTNTARSY